MSKIEERMETEIAGLYVAQSLAVRLLKRIYKEFNEVHERDPEMAELAWIKEVGATAFINSRDTGGGKSGGGRTVAAKGPTEYAEHPCPACGSKCYDNQNTKTNPKAPDFKCSNKGCRGGKNGQPWVAWSRDFKGNPLSIEEVFGLEPDYSDEALEAEDEAAHTRLPF